MAVACPDGIIPVSYTHLYRRRATYGSLIQIGLKKENNGSNDYSVATFRLLRDFEGEELAQIRAYANGFKEQIKACLLYTSTFAATAFIHSGVESIPIFTASTSMSSKTASICFSKMCIRDRSRQQRSRKSWTGEK